MKNIETLASQWEIRETLTEGQTFFMFKRLNRDIFNGSSDIKMTPEKWVVPIPYSESAYQ